MTTIDSKVVELKFDNAQFERETGRSMRTLESLKKGLRLDGASKGLDEVGRSASRLNFANIAAGVEGIHQKLSMLNVAATAIFSNLAMQAAGLGAKLISSLSIKPALDGFREYETNMNSIQTILANTQSEGAKLKDVTGALDELNTYSDKTIYNFSEMARNIGTFTAAGVSLKDSTASIKGIANLAAMSGSSSQQAATAMYQLSQAIAAGRVNLMDWNSVVNAGMGGKAFQTTLIKTYDALHGGNTQLAKDLESNKISFRDSMQQGWLSAEVLTTALKTYTGDMSAAEMKAKGFSDAQVKWLQQQATTANDAATKVKTFSQLMQTLAESAGSGWAKTWQLLFGDFDEAKTLFTSISNVLGGFIQKSSDARNNLVSAWKDMGGRTKLIEGISNIFKSLTAILSKVGEAFREIFPPMTAQNLMNMTNKFVEFTKSLKPSEETLNNIKRVAAGFFAVFGIGFEIIKKVGGVLKDLFVGVFGGGTGASILKMGANFGDFLVKLHETVKAGEGVNAFFKTLGAVLGSVGKVIGAIGRAIASAFTGMDFSGADNLLGKLNPLQAVGKRISDIFSGLKNVFAEVNRFLDPLTSKIGEFVSNLGKSFVDAFSKVDYNAALDTINTGLLAGITLLFKKFLANGFSLKIDGGQIGMLDKLKGVFDGITGALTAMQTNLQSQTLLRIAGALALLTASVVALSMIDSAKLTKALAAITVMFTQLMGGMMAFQKIVAMGAITKLPAAAAGLIALALAVDILAIAVAKLGKLSWSELAKGLLAVTGLLAGLVATANLLPAGNAKMISTGVGMAALAVGVLILAKAVKQLGSLSWGDLAKGLAGVSAVLVGLALFTRFSDMDKMGALKGAGIALLAGGIYILAKAAQVFASISWEGIVKGLVGMAGGLTLVGAALLMVPPSSLLSAAAILVVATSLNAIAAAMAVMSKISWAGVAKGLVSMAASLTMIAAALLLVPPTTLLSAAAIFTVAASLNLIAAAMATMGDMSWEGIAKAIVAMASSLGIIAVAMMAMTTALPGAAALVVVVAALNLLVPVLVTLGAMSWESIGKGLLALAGAFVVIAAGAALLTPTIPSLLGFAAALVLIGAGVALAGVGILAFASALTMLAGVTGAVVGKITQLVISLAQTIPVVGAQIGQGLVAMISAIAARAPELMNSLQRVLTAFLAMIIANVPKIANAGMTLILKLITTIGQYMPQILQKGTALIVAFLQGMSNRIPSIVTSATTLVVTFLNAMGNNIGRITDAGVQFIIKFLNGTANAINSHQGEMNAAGRRVGEAIISGMVGGLSSGVSAVTSMASSVASSAISAARNVLDINSPSKEFIKIGESVNEGFAKGLHGSKDQVTSAVESMGKQIKSLASSAAQDMVAGNKNISVLQAKNIKNAKDMAAAQKKLAAAQAKARSKSKSTARSGASQVKTAQAQINKLQAQRKANNASITDNKKRVAADKKIADTAKKLAAAHAAYNIQYQKLQQVAGQRDIVRERIVEQEKAYQDLLKAQADYTKGLYDNFSKLPQIAKDTKLVDYMDTLKTKFQDMQELTNSLSKLHSLGLNDKLYKQFVESGTESLPMIRELLLAGKTGVEDLNRLSNAYDRQAQALSQSAGDQLFETGRNVALGIINGLKSQEAALTKQMESMSSAMIKAFKKALGIKSPSRVFAELGEFTGEGFVKGLDAYSSNVGASSQRLGKTAIDSLRKSITDISTLVDTSDEFTPSIRPVLDLSNVESGARRIGDILNSKMTPIDSSYSSAVAAAKGYDANANALAERATNETGKTYQFIQNNTSPKALDRSEIYRQTKNQLSLAKGV